MTSPVTPARARPNLAHPLRAVQAATYALGFAFTLIVLFADPGHRIAFAAMDAFATLIHLILK